MSCECFLIGGPFIGADPDCEIHCQGGYEDRISELEAENESLRQALKRIAPTSCPRCGDRSIQQIARDALREGE